MIPQEQTTLELQVGVVHFSQYVEEHCTELLNLTFAFGQIVAALAYLRVAGGVAYCCSTRAYRHAIHCIGTAIDLCIDRCGKFLLSFYRDACIACNAV